MGIKANRAGETTRAAILAAGLDIMRADPAKVNSHSVARAINRTHQIVLYHFPSVVDLRNAIAAHALDCGDAPTIRYLIVTRHDAVKAMAETERGEWLAAG